MKSTGTTLIGVILVGGSLIAGQGVLAASRTSSAAPESRDPTASAGSSTAATMPMQQHMRQMFEQMAEIQETDAPVKRRQLLDEHMASMRDMMNMMHGMMAGQGMTGGPGMMGGQHRGMMGPDMMGPCARAPAMMGQNRMSPGSGQPRMMGPGAMGGPMDEMMGRLDIMEERMNMMQMMMDQMLKSQSQMLKETE